MGFYFTCRVRVGFRTIGFGLGWKITARFQLCFAALFHILKITANKFINDFEIIGFMKTGHNVVQDSSATKVSSQTPIATIMSTSEAGKIKGGCFGSIVSFFENLTSSLINIKSLGFANAGHSGTQDSSATQASSQTPLASIMSTGESGKIEWGCFRSIVSYFENYCKQVH